MLSRKVEPKQKWFQRQESKLIKIGPVPHLWFWTSIADHCKILFGSKICKFGVRTDPDPQHWMFFSTDISLLRVWLSCTANRRNEAMALPTTPDQKVNNTSPIFSFALQKRCLTNFLLRPTPPRLSRLWSPSPSWPCWRWLTWTHCSRPG